MVGACKTGDNTNGFQNSQHSPDICGQDQLVPAELESTNQRSLGAINSYGGLPHTPPFSPLPTGSSSLPSPLLKGSDTPTGGDSVIAGETSYTSNPSHNRGLLLKHVYGSQERWQSETSYQPKKAQQPCEVCLNPYPANRVPRDVIKLPVHGTEAIWRKDLENQGRSTQPSDISKHLCLITSTTSGQAKCNKSSTSDGSPVLSFTPVMSQASSISQLSRPSVNNRTIPSSNRGPAVVGTTPCLLEWEKPNLSSFFINNRFRCITPGLGSHMREKTTRDPWSPQEQALHINCLELLAAILAVQTFVKRKIGISILLRIDNTTAVAYINRKGGTASPILSNLARTLWLWCAERNISLQVQHLLGGNLFSNISFSTLSLKINSTKLLLVHNRKLNLFSKS